MHHDPNPRPRSARRRTRLAVSTVLGLAIVAGELFAPSPTAGASPGQTVEPLSATLTATQVAQGLVGSGITVSNVTTTGDAHQVGRFTGMTSLGFAQGVVLSSGSVDTFEDVDAGTSGKSSIVGPNDDTTTGSFGLPGDGGLDLLVPEGAGSTQDAAILEFDFVPTYNKVRFDYLFGSEEYNEFVDSQFNDVFGLYVNGVNCAKVNGSPVTINTVNLLRNADKYRNNTDDPATTEVEETPTKDTQMDGFTATLTCEASVNVGVTNHIKFAIADTSDTALDSSVLLRASSIISATEPGAPTGVSAVGGNGQATVSWTAPASNGGSPITGYVVTPYVGATAQTPVESTGTGTSKVVTGLTNGTAYTFTVAAVNAIGSGSSSAATSTVTPNPTTAPGAPTGVTGTAGNAQVALSWTAPASNGGSAITSYVITPYIGATAQPTVTSAGTGTTKTVTGLTNGTAYTFKVAAVNAIGTGAPSAASSSLTPVAPATAPGAPTGVSAVAGNAQATVNWTAPASNGGSAITGYVVTPFIGATAQSPINVSGTGTSKVVTGLTNGTAYTFKVAAVNAVGTGAPSAASSAVTPVAPATVPGAPTGVTGTAGNAQVALSWTAPASNGGSAITSYVITPYIGATAQPTVTSSGSGTTKTVTGLTNGTAYTFKVAAVNAVGTGAPSAASSALTPTVPVAAPYAPFASWSAFVKRQYLDLTNKAPTTSQLNSWVSQLTAGTKTKGDLDDALRRGSENLANVDPVVRIYRAFLGRTPDAGGLKFWINRKRNVFPAKTWTVTQIATEFTKSNEFTTKYGSLTNRQFVTRIYTDVLGRTADPSGVNYWTGKLDRKERTKAQVMVGFSESNEYKTKQAQNTDVAVAYIYLMGRAPTSAEVTDWTTRQKAGTAHKVLLAELLNSGGYATRIAGL